MIAQLIALCIGGMTGIGLGYLFLFHIPDRLHARRTVRQFDAFVASLPRHDRPGATTGEEGT